jgi:hypothetical protein
MVSADISYWWLFLADGSTNIFTNFAQYKMDDRLVDLVACDGSRPCWRRNAQWYDAIVGDRTFNPQLHAECTISRCGGTAIGSFYRLSNLQRHTECELAHVRSARRSSGRSRRPASICTTPAPCDHGSCKPFLPGLGSYCVVSVVSVLAATCPTSLSPCPMMCRTCCETCSFSPHRRWLWADDSSTGCPPPTSACPPPLPLQLARGLPL